MEEGLLFQFKRFILICVLLTVGLMAWSIIPARAAESFITPAPAENKRGENVGPSTERHEASGNDRARPDRNLEFYYRSEQLVVPDSAEMESAESIGSTIERRDVLGYDPTTHSLFPDFYYRYRAWREEIQKKIRLGTVFSYDTLAQMYADKSWSVVGGAGDATFSGRWLMFGQRHNRPVYLSFRMRHRHAYTNLAPSELSSNVDLFWKTVDGFNDSGFQVPDLYVSQELADGRLTVRYGQFSIDNFVDTHKLGSAKRYFLNQAFSANPAVAFPSFGAGATMQWQDTKNWDLAIGVSNIQGTAQEELVGFGLDSSALFYAVQGGYNFKGIGNRDARVQLLGWESRNNSEEEFSDGSGISLTLEQEGANNYECYVARYAYTDGDAAQVDQLFMLGRGNKVRSYHHFGFGVGLGRSDEDSSAWQGVVEIYYRWQVAKELMITPDLQVILGEGLEGGDAVKIVAGLRAGITF